MEAVAATGQVAGICWVGVLGLDNVGEGDEGEAVDIVWVKSAVAARILFLRIRGRWEEAGGGCVERGMFGSVGDLMSQ